MLQSLCDCSDAYILVKETVIVADTVIVAGPNNRNKNIIFKSFAPFTDCRSKVNNTLIDNGKDIDIVIL